MRRQQWLFAAQMASDIGENHRISRCRKVTHHPRARHPERVHAGRSGVGRAHDFITNLRITTQLRRHMAVQPLQKLAASNHVASCGIYVNALRTIRPAMRAGDCKNPLSTQRTLVGFVRSRHQSSNQPAHRDSNEVKRALYREALGNLINRVRPHIRKISLEKIRHIQKVARVVRCQPNQLSPQTRHDSRPRVIAIQQNHWPCQPCRLTSHPSQIGLRRCSHALQRRIDFTLRKGHEPHVACVDNKSRGLNPTLVNERAVPVGRRTDLVR